jgi:hypothetical protein
MSSARRTTQTSNAFKSKREVARPALKTVSRSNASAAVRKADPAASKDWEEF